MPKDLLINRNCLQAPRPPLTKASHRQPPLSIDNNLEQSHQDGFLNATANTAYLFARFGI